MMSIWHFQKFSLKIQRANWWAILPKLKWGIHGAGSAHGATMQEAFKNLLWENAPNEPISIKFMNGFI